MPNLRIPPALGAVLLLFSLAVPASEPASEKEIRDAIALGSQVFGEVCARCHQNNGEGEGGLYPSLHNPALLHDRTLLVQTILSGRKGHHATSGSEDTTLMPSLNFLSDIEIIAVIAYITNNWGGDVLMVSEQEVRDARNQGL